MGHRWVESVPSTGFISSKYDTSRNDWYIGLTLEMPLDNLGARSDLALKEVERMDIEARIVFLDITLDVRSKGLFDEIDLLDRQLITAQKVAALAKQRFESAIPLTEKSSRSQLDIFAFQTQLREQLFSVAEIETEIMKKRAQILLLQGDLLAGL